MKIIHVIAGLPHAGGMSELVPLLALEQHRLGHGVAVVTVGAVGAATALKAERVGVRVIGYRSCRPHFLYYSFEMCRNLGVLIKDVDLVHVHGCWTFPVWWGCHLALKLRKPFVRSPHGCLAPERLKISRWKKVLAGLLFDRRYFESATVIHATAESEAQEVLSYLSGCEDVLKCERSKVLKCGSARVLKLEENGRAREYANPRVVVIPNGVDVKAFDTKPDRAGLDRRWPECVGKHVALFLSRLHPIKGLDLLVEAWSKVRSSKVLKCESSKVPEYVDQNFSTSPWHLLIAGPDEQDTLNRLQDQVGRLGLDNSVTFCGALYKADRAGVMGSADLFVLPTRNENFGLVVAESLACGVPVITTKGAPWSELLGNSDSSLVEKSEVGGQRSDDASFTTNALMNSRTNELPPNELMNERTNELAANGRCGWWVEIGVEPLVEALREAMSLTDEERHAMGENGRRLVEAKYQWESVAQEMEKVYSGIVNSEP